MYDLNDTIVAVSSPAGVPGHAGRAIVRITGPATLSILRGIFRPDPAGWGKDPQINLGAKYESPLDDRQSATRTLLRGLATVDEELQVDAVLYLFFAPYSYTGDDVAEIHVHAGAAVTEALLENLLRGNTPNIKLGAKPENPRINPSNRVRACPECSEGTGLGAKYQLSPANYQSPITTHYVRMAGPGEFTARAYLTGKIDLAQAEAVNEVVVSSNSYQLTAAEKLLAGRLGEATDQAQSAIMDLLGLIEAGIDFSCEDIEFISRADAVAKLAGIKQQLERLASAGISYESVIDLPAVGIAGAPNAGKSTLLNKLLGTARSIVSRRRKTTRDVLTGELSLAHSRCVLFDCAGLLSKADNILDEMAQQAAIEALRNSSVVVFCVDVSNADWAEDVAVRGLIEPKTLIPVATKCDLLPEGKLADCLVSLNGLFGREFLGVSAKTGAGLDRLRATIDTAIVSCQSSIVDRQSSILLTARHRQAVADAIRNIGEAVDELSSGNEEVAAMLLRAAYQCICDIHQPASGRLDEQILQQIFSRFCIGK
jgi:tRNA modification GTPase